MEQKRNEHRAEQRLSSHLARADTRRHKSDNSLLRHGRHRTDIGPPGASAARIGSSDLGRAEIDTRQRGGTASLARLFAELHE